MAEWKKIVVSGSDISQLVNDSGYLSGSQTIASASVAARATTLSPDATASFADRATSASIADALSQLATASHALTAVTASHALNVPDTASFALNAQSSSVAGRATLLSADATASFADLASDARTATSASIATTAGTASVADRATTLSADATASFADLAGTVHDGNITTAKLDTNAVTTDKITDGNVTNAKLANDSVTIGTTEIDLGTTATSIAGLDSISATTGSFVLQVFESSSTIITSGSNIFGDAQNDIQQFTGSILQTGSFTTTGTVTADVISSDKISGSFSGSFQGDGSGLTGLATTLTVDGDTGTADADLIQDDLQVIGTANEIVTAVTKVGTDVKVTLSLPDTIEATASVATRANALAPTATASFADSATTASQADSATSASATIAGATFPTTAGLEGQALLLNSGGDFEYGDAFGTGSTKKLNQSVAATTWSFQHDLNEVYPIVQAYDSAGDQLLPERVESIDANNVKLYFASSTAGVAAAMVGGMGVSASNATRATSASQADNATSASHALGGAGDFSGSFIGDGSGLTGVAGDFNFQGDSGATTINLLSETASFLGTAEEIVTTVTDDTLTISLPDDVTIGNNLTITNDATVAGNLTVGGSIVSASSLAVEDQFIILASGSNGAIDGGIIVNQIDDDPDGKGKAFAYDSSANRWALESNLNDTASVITPDAFMGVIQEGTATPVGGADPVYGGTNGNGTIFVDTNNNEAYIYI